MEGTADGTEVITVSPKVEEGEENDVYYIFDQIGNGAIANQTNGTVPVKDKTPPLLVNDADPVETGVVYTEISTNLYEEIKYFNDTTPTVWLKASDAASTNITLACQVNGGDVLLSKDGTCSNNAFADIEACVNAGAVWTWGAPELLELTITSNIPTPIGIMSGFTATAYFSYDDDDIQFFITDESDNILKKIGTNTDSAAAIHPAIILDTQAASFIDAQTSMADDNSNDYVTVVFDEAVFGNNAAGARVSNLTARLEQNGGTATAASHSGIQSITGEEELLPGASSIR
ncbi:uncharacterized protein METZ01_LOCUS368911, partial [marine metagenome]